MKNNEFCNPKFCTIFLIFMSLILSFEEVEGRKKKKEQRAFKPTIIPYPLQIKIIPKIQILQFLFIYLTSLRPYRA